MGAGRCEVGYGGWAMGGGLREVVSDRWAMEAGSESGLERWTLRGRGSGRLRLRGGLACIQTLCLLLRSRGGLGHLVQALLPALDVKGQACTCPGSPACCRGEGTKCAVRSNPIPECPDPKPAVEC